MKTYRRVEVKLHVFLILAPDGSGWSGLCSGCFTPKKKNQQYPLDRMLSAHQSQSECGSEEKKLCSPTKNLTPSVHLVANHFTD